LPVFQAAVRPFNSSSIRLLQSSLGSSSSYLDRPHDVTRGRCEIARLITLSVLAAEKEAIGGDWSGEDRPGSDEVALMND
jgi:hypothetical protein